MAGRKAKHNGHNRVETADEIPSKESLIDSYEFNKTEWVESYRNTEKGSYSCVIQRGSDVLQEDVIVINGKGGSDSSSDKVLLSGLVSVKHVTARAVIPHQHSYIQWRFL